jgi:hypothetical protein
MVSPSQGGTTGHRTHFCCAWTGQRTDLCSCDVCECTRSALAARQAAHDLAFSLAQARARKIELDEVRLLRGSRRHEFNAKAIVSTEHSTTEREVPAAVASADEPADLVVLVHGSSSSSSAERAAAQLGERGRLPAHPAARGLVVRGGVAPKDEEPAAPIRLHRPPGLDDNATVHAEQAMFLLVCGAIATFPGVVWVVLIFALVSAPPAWFHARGT